MKYGVVVGTQRTGTTVLRSVLGTHPDIATFGEVFLNRHSNMKESYYGFLQKAVAENSELVIPSSDNNQTLFTRYMSYLEELCNPESECLTIDCKYNFLMGAMVPGELGINRRPHLLHLFRLNNVKIIHLIRKDVLATYVSSLLSVKNQVWATDDLKKLTTRSVVVPTENLVGQLQARVDEQNYFLSLLNDVALTVAYEDMIVENEFSVEVMDKVAKLLSLENKFDLEPRLKKMAPEKAESIQNYGEVQKCLKGTKFEQFL